LADFGTMGLEALGVWSRRPKTGVPAPWFPESPLLPESIVTVSSAPASRQKT
jgi:hypothetical protein